MGVKLNVEKGCYLGLNPFYYVQNSIKQMATRNLSNHIDLVWNLSTSIDHVKIRQFSYVVPCKRNYLEFNGLMFQNMLEQ